MLYWKRSKCIKLTIKQNGRRKRETQASEAILDET